MKVLVTGVNGQLGYDVCRHLEQRELDFTGADIQDFDLTKKDEVDRAVAAYKPDAVVHCAAYTAVDRAESNADLCRAVNVLGTANIADACARVGSRLIYISTDYVFSGEGETPFETDSQKAPKNVYGLTKSEGEDAALQRLSECFIVRTSWVFGLNGNNFVKTMLRLFDKGEPVRVVNDQIGSPTYTWDLAQLLCDMLVTDAYGIYHATNEGVCSWYDFAKAIAQKAGKNCPVLPVTTAEYGVTAASRPANSRLSKKSLDAAGFDRLPPWEDALDRYLAELLG